MRILHTSDWHLGRHLNQERLLPDQEHALRQLIEIAADYQPHAVLVAGDVYDRAVPPPDAVALLDDVLSELTLRLGIDVVLIAGNHDSPQRLTFGSRLLARSRLHIAGAFENGNRLRLTDEWGSVDIFALPYLEPALAREELEDPEIPDHDAAARAMVARIRTGEIAPRTVLLAHAFLAGAEASDSERPLTMAGAGIVAPDAFAGFSYVALGHLHRAQTAAPAMEYSGSILKYSFQEADHQKSVTLVDLDAQGACHIERAPLHPRRDLRCIAGRFADLLKDAPAEGREDLLLVRLLDDGPILDAAGRLREVYPNVLAVEQTAWLGAAPPAHPGPARELTDLQLFSTFFEQTTGQTLDDEDRRELAAVLDQAGVAERIG